MESTAGSNDQRHSATALSFKGFGGLELVADAYGSPDDPAALLLHGAGQSRRSWRAAARSLAAAGRYVIAIDLRGHGDSDWARDGRYDLDALAEDLRAVLAQLSTRPVVVGASAGGLIALEALRGAGEQMASGLVLVDAAPWLDQAVSARLGAVLRRHAQGFVSLKEAAAGAAELLLKSAPPPDALEPRLRREADGRYYWRWDPSFLDGVDISDFARFESAAAGLTLPLLIVHGEDSEVVTHAAMQRFRELLPSAEFVEIEGAGHLVASDRFDAFNATLLEFLERRLPRAPILYRQGSNPQLLRDALGCFATGVIIATTLDAEGKPVGLTANSFTSVSLDPPLVLFCLAKTAGSLPAFDQARAYSVNVLHIGQQPTSIRFSKRGEPRFEAIATEHWETGVPLISSSLASIECVPYARYEAGDHIVFIGEVKSARFEPRRDPLLYFRGKYRRLHFV